MACKPRCWPGGNALGAEFGLNALGDFAHVGAAMQLRLELAHKCAHGGHAFRIDTSERLVDEGVDFFGRELGRKEGLDNRDLGIFDISQLWAVRVTVLACGVTTLLNHFVHDRERAGVIYLYALVHFNTFEFRQNQANGAKGCLLYTSPSPRDATLSRMPSSA